MPMPSGFYELEAMAERVRDLDATLAAEWLEPDGKYQLQGMTLHDLTRRVVDGLARDFRPLAAAQFPTLYCAWGRARVGSTALINMFGIAGLPAYFQPVKAALRWALSGGSASPWKLPPAAERPCIFSKDVAGPYLLAECLYIPLQILVEAGYPKEKLHVVILDRDPVRSLASWLDKWSDRLTPDRLIRNYVLAALNARRVEDYALRAGVPVTHYVYEASKDAVRAARALFHRLGIAERFTTACVTDWAEMGQLDSEHSGIIHPPEPPVYFVAGLHASDTAYRYRERGVAAVTDEQREILARTGVEAVYRRTAEACARELGLEIEPPAPCLPMHLASGARRPSPLPAPRALP